MATSNVYSSATYTHRINYYANGGGTVPSQNHNSKSSSSSSCTVKTTISSTTPTRTGYRFLGYAKTASGSVAYQPGGSISHTFSRSATFDHSVSTVVGGVEYTTNYYTSSNKSYNSSLYAIWEASISTVSTTNGTLGTAQTITITRNSSSYTHTLKYKFGSATGTIGTGIATSKSWTPSTSLAAQFPSAKSGTCTITCETYSGSTLLGSSTTTCTLTIPSSVCCTVASVAVTETVAGLAAKFGAFVQGKSKAKLTGTINSGSGSPAYGATVSAYAITTNGQTLTSNGATTGFLSTSGSNSYSFKITDTRGYTHTKNDSYTVLAYSAPTCSATIQRNGSDGTKIDVSYSWSISSCNSHNDKTYAIKYKVNGGGSWTTKSSGTLSAYSGSGTYSITGLQEGLSYDVQVSITDYFGTAASGLTVSATGNRIFHISHSDKTIARHGANPADGWDHQFFSEQFHGLIDVTPRRTYITPSTAGWYRVLELDNESASTFMMASIGNTIVRVDIAVNGNYESHSIVLRARSSSGPYFNEEFSQSSSSLFVTKIRYIKQDDNIKSHIDIYFDASTATNIGVDFDIKTSRLDRQPRFVAVQTLSSVADSPTGETILTEYNFSENGTGDINVNGTVTGQGFADLLFGVGTAIASNTDCDTLQAEGKYTCPTSSVGSSLSNAPYSLAFGMLVLRVAEANRLVQIAMPNSTSITMKLRYYNGSSWTAWKTLTPA